MQFLVSGASGMIGSAVVSRFTASGHRVLRLTRSLAPAGSGSINWNPESGQAPALPDGEIDAVIHLAGENIGSGRWNKLKKERIRNSRIAGARMLLQSLACLRNPPKVLLAASAVGYYGDRGDEILREDSSPGTGFLAGVCRELEAEVGLAGERGIRAVSLRFGVVLSRIGGALPMMLRPFRIGLGGALGSGRQFMSWIVLEDAVRVIEHCLAAESLLGAVNASSPQPVRNHDFAKVLGRVLRRPALLAVPSFALRLAVGEMADEALLASQRVEPARLQSSNFAFRCPDLEGALRNLLFPGN